MFRLGPPKGAEAIIRKQSEFRLKEVWETFAKAGKHLTQFEAKFIAQMAADNNLTSAELGVDTIIAYRRAMQRKQKDINQHFLV